MAAALVGMTTEWRAELPRRVSAYYTPAMVETIARAVMAADWPMARVSALAGAGPLLSETSEAEEPAVTPEADPGHQRPVLLDGLMPIDVEEEIVNASRAKNDDIEDRRRWNMLRWTGARLEEHATEGPYRETFLSTEDGGWLHLPPYVAPVPRAGASLDSGPVDGPSGALQRAPGGDLPQRDPRGKVLPCTCARLGGLRHHYPPVARVVRR